MSKGERPPKPASAEVLGLTPAIWELTTRCWLKKAAKRPDADEVLAHLEGMSYLLNGSEFTDDTGLIGEIVVPPSPSLFKRVKSMFRR